MKEIEKTIYYNIIEYYENPHSYNNKLMFAYARLLNIRYSQIIIFSSIESIYIYV